MGIASWQEKRWTLNHAGNYAGTWLLGQKRAKEYSNHYREPRTETCALKVHWKDLRLQTYIPSEWSVCIWELQKWWQPLGRTGGYLHTFRMECLHLGTAKMMAAIRENWWIPKLRSLVKKTVRKCNICKVFSARPLPCPAFRSEMSRPFQHAGVDFAGPLVYRQRKTEEGKEYVLIFTCAVVRAVHLEVTKPQTAKEFQRKLNAFITRRTRPQLLISERICIQDKRNLDPQDP